MHATTQENRYDTSNGNSDPRPKSYPLGRLVRGLAGAENQPFQNMVMFHIQLKGMKHTVTFDLMFCPYTLPLSTPAVGSNGHFSILKVVKLYIQLKGMKHRTPRKQIFCPLTHLGQKCILFSCLTLVMLHIK